MYRAVEDHSNFAHLHNLLAMVKLPPLRSLGFRAVQTHVWQQLEQQGEEGDVAKVRDEGRCSDTAGSSLVGAVQGAGGRVDVLHSLQLHLRQRERGGWQVRRRG